MDKIGKGIRELDRLEKIHLNFFNNGLGFKSGESIGAAVQKKRQIKKVTILLRSNLLKAEGVALLMDQISSVVSIEKLKLDFSW